MVRLELLLTAGRLLMYSSLGEGEGKGGKERGRAALAQLTSEGGNGGGEPPAAFTAPTPRPDGRMRSRVLTSGLARFLLSQDGKADLVS